MSIPVLTQVYDEVRRLSIAGSVLAVGDFRLKKLIPPLEQSGQKAPVFAKVAGAVTKLVESNEKSSADALLELSTLVNAILYTQGETGLAGKLQPIKTTDLGQRQTQTSARVLKPLLEALTTTGSGRLEVIKDAHERGAFRDLRLVSAALDALDDPYPEIADLIAKDVLPIYGAAILPELREKFDPKGKGRGGHVRRLRLMHQLDREGSRAIVKQALDEGTTEIRVQAIECLGSDPDDLDFLLEQSKAKAKDVRTAALRALANSDAAAAVQALSAAIEGNDLEIAIESARASRNPDLLKFVQSKATAEFQELLKAKEKDKAKLGKQVTRVLNLLRCLRGRDDAKTESFLINAFEQRDKLVAIKAEPSGSDVLELLVLLMANCPKQAQAALIDSQDSLTEANFAQAFVAACRSRSPGQVFELFSPYLLATSGGKKTKKVGAAAKAEVLSSALRSGGRYWHLWIVQGGQFDFTISLDPRWLDLAVELGDFELVRNLAVPGHVAAGRMFMEAFEKEFKNMKEIHQLNIVLGSLIRMKHPDATDAMLRTITKLAAKGQDTNLWWTAKLIGDLPADAAPKLEAVLPSLSDKALDYVLDGIQKLKNKAAIDGP